MCVKTCTTRMKVFSIQKTVEKSPTSIERNSLRELFANIKTHEIDKEGICANNNQEASTVSASVDALLFTTDHRQFLRCHQFFFIQMIMYAIMI